MQQEHPESHRVADVGVAAGQAWRSATPEQKAVYEERSVASKVHICVPCSHAAIAVKISRFHCQCGKLSSLCWKSCLRDRPSAIQANYAQQIAEYLEAHPREPKRRVKEYEPGELRRPTSAYFFFLNDFREAHKVCPYRPLEVPQ